MKPFRNRHPQRTYNGSPKKHYLDYRVDLVSDFDGRCGYTDCLHMWWLGGFEVDHFAPRKPKVDDPTLQQAFRDLEHEYNNLIYACPQVNRAKGNDWPTENPQQSISVDGQRGYLHPCDVDFNDYFERTNAGAIVPKDDPIAQYMWRKLKLYLKRYEIYWRLEQLAAMRDRLSSLERTLRTTLPEPMRVEILESIRDLSDEHSKYMAYLQVNYPEVVGQVRT